MRTVSVLVLLCCAAPIAAQDSTLDRVQNLAVTGRFTEARNTLERWERDFADPRSAATTADRARALFLRGTLTAEPKEAEDVFVSVVLSYPSTDVAPQALLRLGQGLLASGEAPRAVAYLERLRSEYPGSTARETGWLWLARAQLATGSTAAACASARDGLAATRSDNLRTLLELERDRACTARAVPAAQRDDVARPTPAAPATTARFAVQTAAFRERSSALATAAQLRAKGFDTRVVTTEGSPLYRVRFGVFSTSAEANDAAKRLQSAGFTAMVVSDVAIERSL